MISLDPLPPSKLRQNVLQTGLERIEEKKARERPAPNVKSGETFRPLMKILDPDSSAGC